MSEKPVCTWRSRNTQWGVQVTEAEPPLEITLKGNSPATPESENIVRMMYDLRQQNVFFRILKPKLNTPQNKLAVNNYICVLGFPLNLEMERHFVAVCA